ncbi:MAG: MFS transporter, partial [Solirubrobacteraceae bacterium]
MQLRAALHIDNTDIGLLVTASSLVAAVASIPFGVMADRWRRTWILGLTVGVWGIAMLWSATATSFEELLLSRLLLGIVSAVSGPVIGSLVGDYFAGFERGRIYSYILSGELIGAGIGFSVTGDIASVSWRAAFVCLSIPAFVLAWHVVKLPEPVRGGLRPLVPEGAGEEWASHDFTSGGEPTDAQRLVSARGITPEADRVLGPNLQALGIVAAVKAVLRVRTNVILIVASACGYFYMSGIETFAVEYVQEQYRVAQAFANLLLLVLGAGALLGVLIAGGLSDRLLHRGFLNSRIVVAAVGALGATVLFIPAIFTRTAITALPYLTIAALMLSAQNPPIDAARLDIMPPRLWGRAEGVRTCLRALATSLAPVTFGFSADHLFGGGRSGLQWTFALMLVTMALSGIILFKATRSYP